MEFELSPTKPNKMRIITHHDSIRIVRGRLISTRYLGLIRLLFTSYYLVVLIIYILNPPSRLIDNFVYLTQLSYYSLLTYLLITTYHTLRHSYNRHYLPYNTKFQTHLHFLHYELNLILSMIVSIVYWTFLFKSDLNLKLNGRFYFFTISMHGINSLIMISEMVLGEFPILLRHLPLVIIIIALYLPYAILIHHCYQFWIYPFLDYQSSLTTFIIAIFSIFTFTIIYYLLQTYFHRKRDQYLDSRHPKPTTQEWDGQF